MNIFNHILHILKYVLIVILNGTFIVGGVHKTECKIFSTFSTDY